MKNIRKMVVTIASVLALSTFGLGMATISPTAETTDLSNMDLQIEGASIRYDSTQGGIRFEAKIGQNVLDTFMTDNANYETGILLYPTEKLGTQKLTMELVSDTGASKLDTTDKHFTNDDGTYSFRGYMYNTPAEHYLTPLTAVAYYGANGSYTYSEPLSRSVGYVAHEAYKDSGTTADKKTELAEYIKGYTSVDNIAKFDISINEDGTYQVKTPFLSTSAYNYFTTTRSYGSGTYAMLEFKGANFPGQILFGATDISGSLDATNGVGFSLDNDSYRAYGYNKAQADSSPTYTKIGNKTKLTRGYVYDSNGIFDLDGDGTMDDTSVNQNNTYVVIAGATQSDKNVILEYYLYQKDEYGVSTLLENYSQTLENVALDEGKIYITSSYKVKAETEFKFYEPATEEEQLAKLKLWGENVGWSTPGSSNTATITHNSDYTTQIDIVKCNTWHGYASSIENYVSGTYVMVEFTGVNFPGQILFGATDLSTTTDTTNGVGFDLDTNTGTTVYYKDSTMDAATKTTVKGEYLSRGYVYKSTGIFDLDGDGTKDDTSGNQGKTYVLIAGATNTDSGVLLEYYLYETTDGVSTMIDSYSTTLEGKTVSDGKVFISNSRVVGTPLSVKAYLPDTLANLQTKLTLASDEE